MSLEHFGIGNGLAREPPDGFGFFFRGFFQWPERIGWAYGAPAGTTREQNDQGDRHWQAAMIPHRKTTPDDSFRLDWLSDSFANSADSSSRILTPWSELVSGHRSPFTSSQSRRSEADRRACRNGLSGGAFSTGQILAGFCMIAAMNWLADSAEIPSPDAST